jgi:multidrug efflux system membrane fusion protein
VATVDTYTPEAGRRYSASIVPYRQVTLAFRSGGFVGWFMQVQGADGRMRNIGVGDAVKQADVLARIREKDYELRLAERQGQLDEAQKAHVAAQAQLAAAEAAAVKASEDFQRASTLFNVQSITKPDFDAARAQRDSALAQVEGAKAQIEAAAARNRAAQAGVAESALDRADTEIASPFDGYIVQRSTEVGSLAVPGMPVFAIADLSTVKAVFGLPDLEVTTVKKGAALTLSTDALPGQSFRGMVTAISPVADPATRLFPVEVTLPNSKRQLLAGMIVSLSLGPTASEPVLAAPLSAIVRARSESGGFAVVVVEGSGNETAKVRPVTLGPTYGNQIAIMNGVRKGERVIISGGTSLNDGDAVRVIP